MAIEPVNERPIFPQLFQVNTAGVSMWSTSMIRQLTTVFQQYGYRLNRTLLAGGLTTNANTLTASGGYVLTEDAVGTPVAATKNIAVLHADTSTDDDPQRMGATQIAFVTDPAAPTTYRRARANGAATLDDWGAWVKIVDEADLASNGGTILEESTSGVVIQHAFVSTGAVISTNSQIPWDDSIPQNTEGAEAFSIAFTPKRTDSRLRIKAVLNMRADASLIYAAALFISGSSNALRVSSMFGGGGATSAPLDSIPVVADIASPGITSVDISARFGAGGAGTVYLNGDGAGNRRYGGVACSVLEIEEYMP